MSRSRIKRAVWSVLWFIDDGIHRLKVVPWVIHRPLCDWVDSWVLDE